MVHLPPTEAVPPLSHHPQGPPPFTFHFTQNKKKNGRKGEDFMELLCSWCEKFCDSLPGSISCFPPNGRFFSCLPLVFLAVIFHFLCCQQYAVFFGGNFRFLDASCLCWVWIYYFWRVMGFSSSDFSFDFMQRKHEVCLFSSEGSL